MCGIVGAVAKQRLNLPMGEMIRIMLSEIQHRGNESAGVTVTDGHNVRTKKERGAVIVAIPSFWAEKRKGQAGIGQVRYSTTGSGVSQEQIKNLKMSDPLLEFEDQTVLDPGLKNSQPFYYDTESFGRISVVHNGNLTNALKLRRWLENKGIIFEAQSDTEVILKLICYYARQSRLGIAASIGKAMTKMKGAYSCILLTRKGIWAFRDPLGFRPLKIAETEDSFLFASEPCAFFNHQATPLRNVKPGEIVEAKIGAGKLKSFQDAKSQERAFCIFEDIYLQGIRSKKVAKIRFGFGQKLLETHPLPGLVIPILNTGEGAALGYHSDQSLKFPGRSSYFPCLYRDPQVSRTFLEPKQKDRIAKNKRKYFFLFTAISDILYQLAKTEKKIWLIFIDDSLIRANVSRTLIKLIRAELKSLYPDIYPRIKIAWLLSSPPYTHPCYFGIDTYRIEELIAANKTLKQVQRSIRANYLGYLPLEAVLQVAAEVHKLKTCDFCHACFSGQYPIPIDPRQDKMSLLLP